MSEQEKNKIYYNASDIIKYLKGELSPLEMHAMEKAALDDPFLADALDGMHQSYLKGQLEKFPADLREINNRLANKIGQQKIPNPSPFIFGWKIAAAVFVILFAGALTVYFVHQPSGTHTLARHVDAVSGMATDSVSSVHQPVATDQETEKKQKPVAEIMNPEKTTSVTARSDKRRKQGFSDSKTDFLSKKSDLALNNKKIEDTDKNLPASAASVAPDRHANPAVAQYEYKGHPTNPNSFYGKVTDEHNKPIALAFVASKDKRVQVLTDDDGNFKLNLNKQDSVINVEISSIGYDPAYITLNSHGVPNIIMLRENNSKGETFGNSSSGKNRLIPEQQLDQDAAPEHGWDDYSKYLQKSKRPPNDSLGLKGIVIVSFKVKKKKKLSDFYIEQSLGPDYDAEAIRLIRDGPSWKLLKKRSATVVVVVGF